MSYISALLSHLRPMQMILCTVLSVVMLFSSGCSTLAATAKDTPTGGTTQLDGIVEKSENAIANPDPAGSLEGIVERSKRGFNEIQGDADRDKMYHSDDTQVPVLKQAEKAMNKLKKG